MAFLVQQISQTNPLVLTLSGTIILILLGIIGYFIAREHHARDDHESKLIETTKELSVTVNDLNVIVTKLGEGLKAQTQLCSLTHQGVNAQINGHSRKLVDYSKRLRAVENKVAKFNGD